MIETLSINELESKANNIYEAIIVMAKRARQINEEQKQLLAKEREYDDEYDDFQEEDYEVPADIEYIKLPKPSSVSVQEFLSDKIKYDYITDSGGNGDGAE